MSLLDDLVNDLHKMLLDDPITKALWEGTIKWGDIPGICDVKPRARAVSVESAESADSVDILRLCSHSRRVAFAPKPVVKHYEPALEVPAFPAGRRTLMAKNLPRDIAVQELRTIFEKYGAIRDIYIPKNMDKSSPYFGTIKGFAKIQFLKADDSARAFAAEWSRLCIRNKNIALEPAAEDR